MTYTDDDEPLIRLPIEIPFGIVALTVEEFEKLEREVIAQASADPTLGTYVLTILLQGARSRYLELKMQREALAAAKETNG